MSTVDADSPACVISCLIFKRGFCSWKSAGHPATPVGTRASRPDYWLFCPADPRSYSLSLSLGLSALKKLIKKKQKTKKQKPKLSRFWRGVCILGVVGVGPEPRSLLLGGGTDSCAWRLAVLEGHVLSARRRPVHLSLNGQQPSGGPRCASTTCFCFPPSFTLSCT